MNVRFVYIDADGSHVEIRTTLAAVPAVGDRVSFDNDGPTYRAVSRWWFLDDSEPEADVAIDLEVEK